MGRAKSNTKRRPKGKRGWRKIDANAFIDPPQKFSLEEQKSRIAKLKNSQLWSQDVKPRKIKKLTKAQKKLKAKRKLKARGYDIDSVETNNKWRKKVSKCNRRQRLLSFKETQKLLQNPSHHTQPKKTAIIKFKNKNKKKINLDNHENYTLNKRDIKNNTDYHKNNPYNLYKTKHNARNTRNNSGKDLWNDEPDNHHNYNRKNRKSNNDQSSEIKTDNDESDDNDDNDDIDNHLKDVKPWKVIKKQDKASKRHLSGGRSVQNNFVSSSLISLPNPGESINPLMHEYYYLKWQTLQLQIKQMFKNQYQKKSTQKWYKENLKTDKRTDKKLQQLTQR